MKKWLYFTNNGIWHMYNIICYTDAIVYIKLKIINRNNKLIYHIKLDNNIASQKINLGKDQKNNILLACGFLQSQPNELS